MAVRRRRPFDDFFGFPGFGEFDKLFEDMLADIGKVKAEPGKPLVYGFSFRMGQDGKPQFEEFGNVKPGKGVEQKREPLVDVIDGKSEVTVIAELPGVDRKDVKLNAAGDQLSLNVTDPDRPYAKNVRLPAEVVESSAKASLKNGILEVVFKKAKPLPASRGSIRVE